MGVAARQWSSFNVTSLCSPQNFGENDHQAVQFLNSDDNNSYSTSFGVRLVRTTSD